jgi:hypothetical protein
VDDVDDAAGRCGLSRSLLPIRPSDAATMTAVPFLSSRGAAGLVSSVALQVARDLDQCATTEGASARDGARVMAGVTNTQLLVSDVSDAPEEAE